MLLTCSLPFARADWLRITNYCTALLPFRQVLSLLRLRLSLKQLDKMRREKLTCEQSFIIVRAAHVADKDNFCLKNYAKAISK